jgi:hypothetical protein
MTTATAQTTPALSKNLYDRFPELPSLKAEFDSDMLNHQQPNLLTMSQDANDKDTVAVSSIMFLHKSNQIKSNFHLRSKRNLPDGDGLIGIRDYIVRHRRINEGHPLPPPTPVMRRY